MASLKNKIQNALDEGRILVLGAQVLIGFQYRIALEKGFEQLPTAVQYSKIGALALLLIALALLMSPTTYHQIVEEGEDTQGLHNFITIVIGIALLPFAIGLGMDFYVATYKLLGQFFGIITGLGAVLVALFFWYGLEVLRRSKHKHEGDQKMMKEEEKKTDTKLGDKIKQVLTEARMVLPGAQALLGFQFASMLAEGFDKLSTSSKYVHLISLLLIALSTVLLMTPSAYHRIVEKGEDTEHFYKFASGIVIAAMIPLALGISSDFFVVARKISGSDSFAIITSAVMLLFFYGLWFGYTLYRRGQERSTGLHTEDYKEQQVAD